MTKPKSVLVKKNPKGKGKMNMPSISTSLVSTVLLLCANHISGLNEETPLGAACLFLQGTMLNCVYFNSPSVLGHELSEIRMLRINCVKGFGPIPSNIFARTRNLTKLQKINCNSVRITQEHVDDLQNLEFLEANSEHLSEIDSTNQFPKLTELLLDDYQSMYFQSNFLCSFPRLKYLTIGTNIYSNVTSLNCGNNNSCCSSLASVTVQKNDEVNKKESTITLECFRGLPNLISIRVVKVKVELTLTSSTENHNLTETKLKSNSPSFITNNSDLQLENLQSLYFEKNKLTNIPFKSLKSLENLTLIYNKINTLVLECKNFPHLKLLNLKHNGIKQISSTSFKECDNLISIDISNNFIFYLSTNDESGNIINSFTSNDLPNLEYLDLQNNNIQYLDCSHIPNNVKILHVSWNPLNSFTATETCSRNLTFKEFYADGTSWDNLENTCFPTSLEVLSLEAGKISTWPRSAKTFSTLINLKEIRLGENDLFHNGLTFFPSPNSRTLLMNAESGLRPMCCNIDFNSLRAPFYCDKYRNSVIRSTKMIAVRDNNLTHLCSYQETCNEKICLKYVSILQKTRTLTSYSGERIETNAVLNCGSLMLTNVPSNLPNDAVDVHLDGNNLTRVDLDEIFEYYPQVKRLYLNNSNIHHVEIKTNHNFLLLLHLADNYLHNLPSDIFSKLPNLSFLYLQNNLLTHFVIKSDHELILNELHLEKNRLSEIDIPAYFKYEPQIKHLYLQFNNVSTFLLFCHSVISSLYLDNNSLSLSDIHCPYQNMDAPFEELHLRNNNFTVLHHQHFYLLKYLKELHLEGNSIRQIESEAFAYLPALKRLYLQRNQIEKIERQPFVHVEELEVLNLGQNSIVSISSSIFRMLPRLKILNLNDNRIATLPSDAFLENRRLEEIHLEGNLIQKIDVSIFDELPFLVSLYLNSNNLLEIVSHGSLYLTSLSELHLENNRLTILNGTTFKGLRKVEKLFLHGNKIHFIDKSILKEIASLQTLTLHDNKLEKLDIWKLGLSPNFRKLTLHENPLHCGCEYLRDLTEYFKNVSFIANVSQIECLSSGNKNRYLLEDYRFQFCQKKDWIIGLSVSLGLLVLNFVIAILAYKYRMEIQIILYSRFKIRFFYDESIDENKQFHAFVAYSYDDVEFVANDLVPGLRNYRLCLHDRNFVVGAFIQQNIISAINSSCCTVIVFSRSFVKSQWCRFEFRTAHEKTLSQRRRPILVILLEDVDPQDMEEEMKVYLKTSTYLRWGDKLFWERLYFALPSLNGNDNERNDQLQIPLQQFDL